MHDTKSVPNHQPRQRGNNDKKSTSLPSRATPPNHGADDYSFTSALTTLPLGQGPGLTIPMPVFASRLLLTRPVTHKHWPASSISIHLHSCHPTSPSPSPSPSPSGPLSICLPCFLLILCNTTTTHPTNHPSDPTFTMEALLRQSRAMCPFLNKTSPATLRSMSTSTSVQHTAPGGGAMSNLQIIARRCPVMGKALSVQSSRLGNNVLSGAFGGSRAYSSRVPKANLHTGRADKAQAVDIPRTRREAYSPHATGHKSAQSTQAQKHSHGVPPAPPKAATFDYESFYQNELDKKHKDKSYRYFNNINRLAKEFPQAHMTTKEDKVTVWCSNDYLGMGRNPQVLNKMHETLDMYGAGAGGTRNISGHNQHAVGLEGAIAKLHAQESALVFSSCYVANDATLATLGSKFPDCVILSDSMNHASMIQGIRHSGAKKMVFKHNDLVDLENKSTLR